jgi:arginine/lysine/ornithine decarboxylase
MALTPRDAFFSSTEAVPAAAAVGRVSSELLCPYPPGVPVLFPGEAISAAAVQLLQQTVQAGGTVTGAADSSLQTLLVVVDE